MQNSFLHTAKLCLSAIAITCLLACSATSKLNDDEQLYTGMKKTVYENYEPGQHFIDTQAEVEAALACPPAGALFGSPYMRTPIPYALWVYNAFSDKKGAIAKWLTQTIGKAPVLLSDVNPELRVTVAENVLQNYGYFQGKIRYKTIDGKMGMAKNDSVPRVLTTKVEYTVNLGPVYKLDSIEYKGFSEKEMSLIQSTPTLLHKDDAFSVSALDEERTRIFNAFKNNGYYFFDKSYITYMADTIQVPQHVQLQICKVDSLPEDALKQWKVGNLTFRIRRQMAEQITDTVKHKYLNVEYGGKKSPLKTRYVLQDLQLRRMKLFSQADLTESKSRLTSKGIFSSTDITFTKVDDPFNTDSIGKINMLVNCILDKPYDFTLSANYTHKTSGRGAPGIGAGFAIRNAFHGGEILSFDLKGSVEFQVGNKVQDRNLNYDMGIDVSLTMPRLLLPKFLKKHKHWYIPPSTMFTLTYDRINRNGYYRRNVFSAELSYIFKPSARTTHTFSPLSISHTRLAYHSAEYDSIMLKTGFGTVSLDEYFTPKMRYTYNYTTKGDKINPVTLSVTLAEAGAATTGLLKMFGQNPNRTRTYQNYVYNFEEYRLFNTALSRYIRADVDFVKSWRTTSYSNLVAHIFAGYIHNFNSSNMPPFAELYFAGGANDLRGFATRGVGPGNYYIDDSKYMYILSNGDFKLTCNLEYRPRIFGSLYGALFIDAGNVWNSYFKDITDYSMSLKLQDIPKQIAVDAGFGLRYDLDFFVLRIDWGFIVHAPYDTGRSGYFNFPSFKKGQCVNFAIGYPF